MTTAPNPSLSIHSPARLSRKGPRSLGLAVLWWRRLQVMTAKELRQLIRDWPLILFMAYGFTLSPYLSGTGINMQLRNASLLVQDHDHSFSSRDLISRFRPPYFRVEGEVARPDDARRLLDEGRAMAILDIPTRFQESLGRQQPVSVQLQVDTTSSPQGLSLASYAERIVGEFGRETARRNLGMPSDAEERLPTVRSQVRVWYNPNLVDAWFECLSQLLRMITVFAVLLPAAAMVREKERGTVEQLLVSPLTPFQIMFSKVLAMTVAILIGVALTVFGILRPVFDVPTRGSLGLYFILTALYIFTTAGLGLFAATLARNQAQVGMMTIMVVAPILLLSGTTTPVEAMPDWVSTVMAFSPLRYYIEVTYGILLKGVGLEVLWPVVLPMILLGAGMFGFGMWRFRRQFE